MFTPSRDWLTARVRWRRVPLTGELRRGAAHGGRARVHGVVVAAEIPSLELVRGGARGGHRRHL
jgi:hypothetical protein